MGPPSDASIPAAIPRVRRFVFLTQFQRVIRLGIRSLWLHRLRSLLTVLGIVFGVCSVIAMLAIGEGASFEAQEQIRNLGSRNILLRSIKPAEEQKVSENRENYILDYGLKVEDVTRIQNTIPGVDVIVPARIVREYVVNFDRRLDCEVVGTVPWYPDMCNHQVAVGRFFTSVDLNSKRNVCVLGSSMARSLFPLSSPLGQSVRVGSSYYRVIGVMEPRSKAVRELEVDASSGAGNAADRMYIPLETARERYGDILAKQRAGSFEATRIALHEVTVAVERQDHVLQVASAIEALMKRTHKKKDYDLIVPLDLLKKAERTKQIFNIVLGSIAAISLLVGGIGIMNIMLANVTERTREIGIRRALGARRKDITIQFLFEAILLSGIGGLLGVVLGIGIPYFVSAVAGMRTIITPWSPIVAFTISTIVGMIFGLYPATRAAKLHPVEALRHE